MCAMIRSTLVIRVAVFAATGIRNDLRSMNGAQLPYYGLPKGMTPTRTL